MCSYLSLFRPCLFRDITLSPGLNIRCLSCTSVSASWLYRFVIASVECPSIFWMLKTSQPFRIMATAQECLVGTAWSHYNFA